MNYNLLPNTDIKVSKICLGTMTYGNQNTEAEGHQQMDYAVDQGVNFFDTAELYPVPANKHTQGDTESIMGSWFKKNGRRDKIILASKVAGPGDYTKHIRKNLSFKKDHIDEAVNKSLKRLQTDYIDLYQLHWPERKTNFFGKRGYKHEPDDPWEENFEAILEALEENIKAGKIRYIGLSNENPWGIMRFLQAAKTPATKIITVQNPYSLLNRLFEGGSAEICHRENIGLLPYSPLGFGVLSGKYRHGKLPPNSRLALFERLARYSGKTSFEATERYAQLAEEVGLSLTDLSLAFVNDRSFVTSNIIGATTLEQLKENIASHRVRLSPDILEAIEAIHEEIPNPAP
ncbi:MAG TPA: aldo/keto reductase [Flavobacteriaceae bacterium]|nr:aldo/keto reductase [Flavobacteriaceae bacterium]|tara:strand:+ start:8314 stop:9351 length:1038 start_codon:yes stop_codon:yes gene_type:complete